MGRDRYSAERAQNRARRRDAAKMENAHVPPPRAPIPDPIIFATDGVSKELKRNGKVIGIITYETSPTGETPWEPEEPSDSSSTAKRR